jgi:adenosylcobinamide-GDP ribazoletransferase
MRSARLAWSFLTRFPGGAHPRPDETLRAAVPWFPLVGVALGGLVGVVYLGAVEIVSSPTAALVTVGVGAIATGAFHEDGLADTFDSFGGATRDRRLEIMHDSRIGTFGALSLVVATGLKVVALASLGGLDGLVALVAAHGLGRAGALALMQAAPTARPDGAAATVGTAPGRGVVGVVSVAALIGVGLGPATAIGVAAVGIVVAITAVVARRHLGGVTGDVLGAAEQVGEIVVLTAAAELVDGSGWLWS